MTLGELIKTLSAAPANQIVANGFHEPHSYRGYYEELAFEPCGATTVGAMLDCAKAALHSTYEGYKGGYFKMYEHTGVYLANYGSTGEEIGPTLLSFMLATATTLDHRHPTAVGALNSAIQYNHPSVYAAAIAKGDARWGSRQVSPFDDALPHHHLDAEMREMQRLTNDALIDKDAPRLYPAIMTPRQIQRYNAATEDGKLVYSEWQCDVRDLLTDVWSEWYRPLLSMEESAAIEQSGLDGNDPYKKNDDATRG